MNGNHNKETSLKYLKGQSGLVLSTISPANEIESSFLFYAVDEQFNFYVVTNKETRKYHNIQKNDKVALVVADEASFTTVQGQGKIAEIKSSSESMLAFNMLLEVITKKVKNWPPPIGKMKIAEFAILKIVPNWLRISYYSDSSDPTQEQRAYQIIE